MVRRTIPEQVLAVLSMAVVEGAVVRLTAQLPRDLYLETNTVLAALGGRWDRKAQGHVFADDPGERIEAALLTGQYERPREDWGFFSTPGSLVSRLIDVALVGPSCVCLEPSAGHGVIAEALAKLVGHDQVQTVELLEPHCAVLRAKGFRPHCGDFLRYSLAEPVDRVVMNPPFARQQDLDHVAHAFQVLKPRGRLVSVMAAGVTFRENAKTVAFRALVDQHGWIEALPEDSFRASGTSVRTVLVVLDKP